MTDILFVHVTLHPPSGYFVRKIIYMYKVFLSLLTHLFESSSLAIYIPHWRQTFLTARENFYNEKTLLWDNSKFQIYSNSLKSIRSWIHTHELWSHFAFDSLKYFFRKFASFSPPIRRKTNLVLTNIPLNVIHRSCLNRC